MSTSFSAKAAHRTDVVQPAAAPSAAAFDFAVDKIRRLEAENVELKKKLVAPPSPAPHGDSIGVAKAP